MVDLMKGNSEGLEKAKNEGKMIAVGVGKRWCDFGDYGPSNDESKIES